MIIRYDKEMYFEHRSLVELIFDPPADLKCETMVDAPFLRQMTFLVHSVAAKKG